MLCQLFFNIAYGQTLIEGSLDCLCFYTSYINVRWDFSETKYANSNDLKDFLSPNYTIEDWEHKVVPAINAVFIESINDETISHGITFVYERDYAEYEMLIAPQTLNKRAKNTTHYTIINRVSGKVEAKISFDTDGGKLAIGTFLSLIKDAYDDAGNGIGNFIIDKTKMPYEKQIEYINKRFEAHKQFIKKEGEEMIYTKVISSPYIQNEDSLYDFCLEIMSKTYNNFKHVSQIENKDKRIFIGKGLFSNYNIECPYTIKIEIKKGKIRVTYSLSSVKHPDGNKMILSSYPFMPQESLKKNCISYRNNLNFILNGIISINNSIENELNNKSAIDDDW